MNISPLAIIALEIKDAPALDPIRFFLQDLGEGQGRIIIECYGRAWSNYWGSMGTDIRTFLLSADAGYIENALHSGQRPRLGERAYLRRIVIAIQSSLRDLVPENNPDQEPA